ncbi:uncharacterized protein LOC116200893 [Punica granatum]|uniref:Uncharacterized protein LOC116200893 n=1 Tax=Punica granatum TaxID=22663 RepID=A0A218W051_PUNGR|nr:uncharacterized protein LOC116200893 [Punica granatum]OWM65933.1 hypothetical protein CDL15_Pgr015358 [Punica granatum]
MPRPGPRPYECVRRAWHSERHQPIRGSIIQQIFRVVTEAHSSATKKNREWKEKLPVVVLQAEEIMYSKANSEAEYLNLETLWERVNDVVDTIIRRDKSSETGDLLPPCVEAALNLGCVPVRASRSQRHNNPRTYLTPIGQDPPSTLLPNKPNQPSHPQTKVACCSYPVLYENTRCTYKPQNVETNSAPILGSAYPLYYGKHHLAEKSHVGPGVPKRQSSKAVLVGTPVGTSIAERPRVGSLKCLLSHEKTSNSSKDAEPGDSYRMRECDLSLRLGLSYEPCESKERSSGDAGSSNSQEFSFFPRESYYNQSLFK